MRPRAPALALAARTSTLGGGSDRRRGLDMVVAIAAAALIVLAPTRAAAADCTAAEALLDLQLLEPAREAFLGLLDAEVPPPCARTGFERAAALRRSAELALQRGRDLEAVGDDEAALAAYVEAVSADRSLTEAIDALRGLLGEVEDSEAGGPYAAAEELLRAGYVTEAQEAARKVVLENPDAGPIPGDLEASARQGWGRVAWIAAGVTTWLLAVIPIVLLFVGVVLLVLTPLNRIHWLRTRLPLRRFFPSQYQVEEIRDPSDKLQLGPTLGAMIEHELELARGGAEGIKHVAKGEIPAELPSLDLGGELKFIGPLLRWLLHPDRLVITGQVYAPTADRSALSLVVAGRGGRVLAAETFNGPGSGDPPDPQTYFELTTQAGAWAVFALHRLRPPRNMEDLKLVGTSDARSYGLFRAGTSLFNRAPDRARTYFLDALEHDAGNLGAMINLAAIYAASPDGYAAALSLLGEAERILEDPAVTLPADGRDSALWYQTRYMQAVVSLHRFTSNQNAGRLDTTDLNSARNYAADVVRATARRLAVGPPRRLTRVPGKRSADRVRRTRLQTWSAPGFRSTCYESAISG